MAKRIHPLVLTGEEPPGLPAPGGRRLYAVGDVHGCFDLVRKALDRIRRDAKGAPYRLIFLGDYVDRGPDAKRTVELLLDLEQTTGAICLRGNHEEMMVRASLAPNSPAAGHWLEHGGRATARSYGAGIDEDALFDLVPAAHLLWLDARPLVHEESAQIFVHAGLDPAKPLSEQGPHECLWIRDRFLAAPPEAFTERRHIVHGHTLQWKGKPDPRLPELLPHRTNLDTGAYGTGILTVGVFDDDEKHGPVNILTID